MIQTRFRGDHSPRIHTQRRGPHKAAGSYSWACWQLAVIIATSTEDQGLVEQARGLAKQFCGQLKAEIRRRHESMAARLGLSTPGSVKAPMIAESVSAESGWDVGRTSLKLQPEQRAR